LKNLSDAEEFLKRTLYLDENNIKALSRKAYVLSELNQFSEALIAINKALELDAAAAIANTSPNNPSMKDELLAQQKEIAIMEKEEQMEKKLAGMLISSVDIGHKPKKDTSTSSAASASSLNGRKEIDSLTALLSSYSSDSLEEQQVKIEEIKKGSSTAVASFLKNLQEIHSVLPAVSSVITSEPLLSIYFYQTHSGFASLLSFIKFLISLQSSWSSIILPTFGETSDINSLSFEAILSDCLSLMNLVMNEKRSCKQAFLDKKLYSSLKELLLSCGISSTACLSLQSKILDCFYILIKDEVLLKAKTLLYWDNNALWMMISQLLGNLVDNILTGSLTLVSSSSSSSTDDVSSSSSSLFNVFRKSFLMMRDLIFSTNELEKSSIKDMTAGTIMNIVYSFGSVLSYLLQHHQNLSSEKKEKEDIIELAVNNFVAFSQYDSWKKYFIDSLPLSSSSSSSVSDSASHSVISLIIDTISQFPSFTANGIAILMNSSLEITVNSPSAQAMTPQQIKEINDNSNKVKEIIVSKPEGIALALSVLSWKKTDKKGTKEEADNVLLVVPYGKSISENDYLKMIDDVDGIYYTRKVGLLSRLISLPSVANTILSASAAVYSPSTLPSAFSYSFPYFTQLCYNLISLTRNNHYDNEMKVTQATISRPKWVEDCLNHYIRVIAVLFSSYGAKSIFTNENLKKILYETSFLSHLLYILPMPRTELGTEVTETSVTQIPKFPISSLLIGNLILILLQFLNHDPYFTKLLFQLPLTSSASSSSAAVSSSASFNNYLIEKSICAMATCQDIRVRKNISILLAKGCQLDAKIREKVTKLRGMQMMMELQKELI
jgi:tetratricopeptide (TPR) repeat protein